MFRRYLVCLYYGILNIGQNDMMPRNEVGYAFMCVTLIASSLLNAILFGDIAGLVISISKIQT